jgi:hypothetical protein
MSGTPSRVAFVVKPGFMVRGLLAIVMALATASAFGQARIQFGTQVNPSPDATAAPPAGPSGPTTFAPTTPVAPPAYGMGSNAAPALPAAPPTYTAPPANPFGPAPAPNAFGPAPMATLNGTIQPPATNWDPYGAPGGGQSSLLSQDPYFGPGLFSAPGAMVTQMQRFLRDVALDYHWFANSSNQDKGLGINDVELSASFNLPFLYNRQTPLTVTPGFAVHYWNGPATDAATGYADMPAQTFDAYLDTTWNPRVNPWFGGEFDVRVGVYSDFRAAASWSMIRIPSKGMAVVSLSPSLTLKAGIWYLDRVRYKLLPTGGLVWTPNPDTRVDILFPNPRFTQRFSIMGNTEWWWYFSGDYGGGTWTIKRPDNTITPSVYVNPDLVDYNDIRIALGLEFKRPAGFTGWFEAGYAFNRELVYRSGDPPVNGLMPMVRASPVFRPDGDFFLRAGMMY